MPLYSYSRIGAFEQCPRKYKFRYIEKPDIEIPEGVEAFMGKKVHETLEQCYRLAQWDKVMSKDELLAYYRRRWEESLPSNLKVVREEMTAEDYFRGGAEALGQFYDRHAPFDDEMTLGLEQKVVFPLDSEGTYKMQGYIDRLSRDSRGRLRIQDYKTSGRLLTQQEVDSDSQLALYQIAVQEMWPDNKGIELVWHYLRFDTTLVSHRQPEQLEELRLVYIDKIRRIERAEEVGNFPTEESNLCDWCEYYALCPAKGGAGSAIAKPVKARPELSAEERTALVDEYVAVNRRIKELEKRLKEIRPVLVGQAEEGTSTLLPGSGGEGLMVSLQQIMKLPTASADPESVEAMQELLKEYGLWEEFGALNVSRLEKALTEGRLPPKLITKLQAFQKPSVRETVRIKKV